MTAVCLVAAAVALAVCPAAGPIPAVAAGPILAVAADPILAACQALVVCLSACPALVCL